MNWQACHKSWFIYSNWLMHECYRIFWIDIEQCSCIRIFLEYDRSLPNILQNWKMLETSLWETFNTNQNASFVCWFYEGVLRSARPVHAVSPLRRSRATLVMTNTRLWVARDRGQVDRWPRATTKPDTAWWPAWQNGEHPRIWFQTIFSSAIWKGAVHVCCSEPWIPPTIWIFQGCETLLQSL